MRYGGVLPTSEPRRRECQRQAVRAAKIAVEAKARYWWGSIAASADYSLNWRASRPPSGSGHRSIPARSIQN
ncbi:MAG: hypothetical protein M3246_07610, partial [Actinomycetota bacterium]|nr:hypothetical protein [Actinomycetota bacterium]